MYTKIDELMWKDSKLKSISTESKLLFIYLLSCQHRNVLGLYNLPKYYVQGDLGYPLETVTKGLVELFENGFVTYDECSETVLINNFLKYNPLENPNQVKGAVKVLPTIPKTPLFNILVNILNDSDNKYLSDLRTGIEQYAKSNGFERVTLTVPKQVEVKEEVKVKEKVKNKGRFTPPTLEEVKSYCEERKNNVDAQKWIDFYEAKGWMIGKNKMTNWKAAVRTWEKETNKQAKPKLIGAQGKTGGVARLVREDD